MNSIIENDRIYRAMQCLILGPGDVRERVADACYILKDINKKELPDDLYNKIQNVLKEASKKGPLKSNDDVIRDAFRNTLINRKKSTYVVLAKQIHEIYLSNLSQ